MKLIDFFDICSERGDLRLRVSAQQRETEKEIDRLRFKCDLVVFNEELKQNSKQLEEQTTVRRNDPLIHHVLGAMNQNLLVHSHA